MTHTRRDFVKTAAGAGAAAGLSELVTLPSLAAVPVESPRLETLSEWLRADRAARRRAWELCQQRIRELDPSIHAWVQVKVKLEASSDGPLSDIPFGAKDIIETQGMATEYGSPVYLGRQGSADAAIIRELRKRGAILLGKTVTTAFAYRTPGPTRNPRNLEHTPGGSSSGSAAAVAAGMVPFTIGEQTRGSVIRPASYCGVTGFKPTYDLLTMKGVLPLAKSLDTLGFFTHTPADMFALWEAMGHPVGRDEQFVFAVPQPIPECEPEMEHAFREVVLLLSRSGVSIKSVDLSARLTKLNEAAIVIQSYEGARFHEPRVREYGARLDPALLELVQDGLKMPAEQYDEARRYVSQSRVLLADVFKSTPVILTPAATGQAPLGLSTTGDPRMNAPWTALGTPAVSIPMPLAGGLPLGLQLTAGLGQDSRLLRAAVRLQERFTAGSKMLTG